MLDRALNKYDRYNAQLFEYDQGCNITDLNGEAFTYGPGNHLTQYGGQTVQYDADGNMMHGPLAGTFADYEYDSLNRLVSVSDGTGVTEYTYDGEGTRMSAGGRTYVTDPNHELSQLLMSSDDQIGVTYYVYAPGYGLLSQDCPTYGYRIFHFDHRGNTIALTDEGANVTDEFSYTVYGEIESGYNSDATIFLFAGQYGVQTDANGLYYMRARYYSPEMGRFVNEDSHWNPGNMIYGNPSTYPMPNADAMMQSSNLYAYAGNNPIRYIDPSGLDFYIYYGKDQAFAAQQYKKQLQKDYKGVPIHMILVDKPDTFYDRWEAMGVENGKNVTIDGVIINLHGTPYKIDASDGNAIDLSNASNSRNIPTLLLLACNGGNLDYDNNLAVQFLNAYNIGNVIAPDGYHWKHANHGFFGIGATVRNSVSKYLDGATKIIGDRESWGFVSYTRNSIGNVATRTNVSNSMNNNKVRAADLFKFVHTTR